MSEVNWYWQADTLGRPLYYLPFPNLSQSIPRLPYDVRVLGVDASLFHAERLTLVNFVPYTGTDYVALSWANAPPSYFNPIDNGQNNIYDVTVVWNDLTHPATDFAAEYHIQVLAPVQAAGPYVSPTAEYSVPEGQKSTFRGQVYAPSSWHDDYNDTTYYLQNPHWIPDPATPDWQHFNYDSSGNFSFKDAPDYESSAHTYHLSFFLRLWREPRRGWLCARW